MYVLTWKKNRTSGILYHKYYHDIVCKKELFRLLNRGVFKRSEFQLAPEFGCTKTNKLPPEFVCTKLNKSFNVPNQGLLPGIILSNKFSFEFYWLSKLFSRSLTNDGTNWESEFPIQQGPRIGILRSNPMITDDVRT